MSASSPQLCVPYALIAFSSAASSSGLHIASIVFDASSRPREREPARPTRRRPAGAPAPSAAAAGSGPAAAPAAGGRRLPSFELRRVVLAAGFFPWRGSRSSRYSSSSYESRASPSFSGPPSSASRSAGRATPARYSWSASLTARRRVAARAAAVLEGVAAVRVVHLADWRLRSEMADADARHAGGALGDQPGELQRRHLPLLAASPAPSISDSARERGRRDVHLVFHVAGGGGGPHSAASSSISSSVPSRPDW